MPKGKKKGRKDVNQAGSPATASDDESQSNNDNGSVESGSSDIHSVVEEENGGEVGIDETSHVELLEDQLKEVIDGTTQKSAKGRETCLAKLVKALSSKVMSDGFIVNRYITIMDSIEHSLKRGKGEEQSLAASLAVLLCVQLGTGDESEKVFHELKNVFLVILADQSASPKARAKCATALGLCAYIVPGEEETHSSVMRALEASFSGSYTRGDNTAPTLTPDMCSVYSSSLASWSLLLTLLPPYTILHIANSHLNKLTGLLQSADLDLRITAGETIALFYEVAREAEQEISVVDVGELCVQLKELANDSHKYRARKDRKEQRSSFREILQAVEGGASNDKYLSLTIKFGREVLELDSWCRKREYDAFRAVLGSGLNQHLAENALLRDIFNMGEPPGEEIKTKASKNEKHFANNAAFKLRTQARNKVRDKRSAVL